MSGAISSIINAREIVAGRDVSISLTINQVPQPGDPEDINDQLDEVRDLLNAHEPGAAQHILARLHEKHRSRFTTHIWYRYYANSGHTFRLLGRYDEAATQFRAALPFASDSNEKAALEILAALVSDDIPHAHELATNLRTASPSYERGLALWLQTAPEETSFEVLERGVSDSQKASPEVLVSLSMAAALRRNTIAAEKYARLAYLAAADWLENALLFADILVQRGIELKRAQQSLSPIRSDLELARDILKNAIERLRPRAQPGRIHHFRFGLAVVYDLLDDSHRSDEELSFVSDVKEPDAGFALNCALFLFDKDKLDPAIHLLESCPQQTEAIKLLLAQLLATRNRGNDQARAVGLLETELKQVVATPIDVTASWVKTLVRLLLSTERPDAARQLLNAKAGSFLPATEQEFLHARASLLLADTDDAIRRARAAASSVSVLNTIDRRQLAQMFVDLGEDTDALQVLQSFVDATSPEDEKSFVLAIALRVKDFGYLSTFCESLRKAGIYEIPFLDVELHVQHQVSLLNAVAAANTILKEVPEGKVARFVRMRASTIGEDAKAAELIERDPAQLPRLDDLPVASAPEVVAALLRTQEPLKAPEFAYETLRKHPDSYAAHVAMILAFTLPEGLGLVIDAPRVVDVGAAVEYREGNEAETSYCVVEDRADLRPVLGEISAKSEMAKALHGRCAGETFLLPGVFGTPRAITIVALLHRYVYRFQRCYTELPKRFPEQDLFAAIDTPLKPDGTVDITEINLQLRFMHEQGEQEIQAYLSARSTLHRVGNILGSGAIGAISAIVNTRDGVIFCCLGPSKLMDETLGVLRTCSGIVLDPTAAATLFHLYDAFGIHIPEFFGAITIKKVISEYTVRDLEFVLDRIRPDRAHLGSKRIGHTVVPVFTEQGSHRRSYDNLVEFIKMIRQHFQIVPGSALSESPFANRDRLVALCGRASVESLILSRRENLVLWTDDQLSYTLLNHSLPVLRAWTQVLAHQLHEATHLGEHFFSKVTLALLRLRFRFTSLTGKAALYAASTARWMVNDEPLRSVLDVISDPLVNIQSVKPIIGALLKEVWTNPVLTWHAEHMTQRVLDRLGARNDGKKLVAELGTSVDGIMGLNVMPAITIKELIKQWLRVNK